MKIIYVACYRKNRLELKIIRKCQAFNSRNLVYSPDDFSHVCG